MRSEEPWEVYDEDQVGQAQCTHWVPVTTEDLEAAAVEVGLSAVPLLFLMHNLEEQGIHLMKPA
jgi:hypothetical protein